MIIHDNSGLATWARARGLHRHRRGPLAGMGLLLYDPLSRPELERFAHQWLLGALAASGFFPLFGVFKASKRPPAGHER